MRPYKLIHAVMTFQRREQWVHSLPVSPRSGKNTSRLRSHLRAEPGPRVYNLLPRTRCNIEFRALRLASHGILLCSQTYAKLAPGHICVTQTFSFSQLLRNWWSALRLRQPVNKDFSEGRKQMLSDSESTPRQVYVLSRERRLGTT